MPFTSQQLAQLDILMQFESPSALDGIKIHSSAQPELIEAARQLHSDGFITQVDGGYLTQLGIEAASHAQSLLYLLESAAREKERECS